jgi:hypothetical protein
MHGVADRRKSGVSLLRILLGVFALALLIAYTISHANFVLGRSMLLAFPGWEVTYRSAWPLLSGGVVARDVVLIPPDGEDAGSFRFASVRVSVPFFDYYRSGFSRKRGALLNAINDVRLEFTDGHGDLTTSFSQELRLFGNVSTAPFEAEGCAEDAAWVETELDQMGLSPRGIDLMFDYHLERGRLVKQKSLHSPGMGRVDSRREMLKHDDFSLFSLAESGSSEVVLDEWHVKDEGFVAARNRHCAMKDKVTADAFVQRHIDSVRRLLATIGLAPQAELEQAYRGYATAGGNIDVVLHYDPPIGAPLYSASDLSTWLPRMRGTFALDGKSLPIALTATAVRPLPDGDEPSTYALLERESGSGTQDRRENALASVPRPDVKDASVPVPRAAVIAADEATEVAKGQSVTRYGGAESPIDPALLSAPDTLTKYSQLAGYVGRDLTVYEHGRQPVRVRVVRVVDSGDVLVRRNLIGGNIEYVLERSRFDHAEQ